jgi:hypothetical protein
MEDKLSNLKAGQIKADPLEYDKQEQFMEYGTKNENPDHCLEYCERISVEIF